MTTVSGGVTINSTGEGHEGNNTTNPVDGHHSHQQRCIGTYPVSGSGSMAMQNSQGVGSVMAGYHGFNDMPTVTCAHAVSPLHGGYDWDSDENKVKWRGIFSKGTPEKPLKKVLSKALSQIHQSPHTSNLPGEISQMTAVDEAWDYVESLLIKLLAMLTARPLPTSKSDVEVIFLNCVLSQSMLFYLSKMQTLHVVPFFILEARKPNISITHRNENKRLYRKGIETSKEARTGIARQ